eukprot:6405-Prorocentrum_lima.AAC.1
MHALAQVRHNNSKSKKHPINNIALVKDGADPIAHMHTLQVFRIEGGDRFLGEIVSYDTLNQGGPHITNT